MKVLFAPLPHGAGTPYAESFLSIVHRTCAIYNVSLSALSRLLLALDPRNVSYKAVQLPGAFLAYSEMTSTLVTQFCRLAGSSVYVNHTLLKLRGALSRNCTGVIDTRIRWCPSCMDPQSGTGYGMLAHAMTSLGTCPLHHRRLRTHCVSCRKTLTIFHASPLRTNCPHCEAPLTIPDPHERLASALSVRELRVLDVVAYATDPDLAPPPTSWSKDLQEGLRFLADLDECGSYERNELLHLERRIRVNDTRLTFASLLSLAEMQMVEPKMLLMAPRQAFSARLPRMGAVLRTAQFRQQRPVDLWFALRRTALDLLDLPPSALLPTWGAVCELAGTTGCGFWQHFPQVSAEYSAERTARLRGTSPVPLARLFAKLYPPAVLPAPRGPEAPLDALEAACEIIDRNLAGWLTRTRASLNSLTNGHFEPSMQILTNPENLR